jgi:hypothetical protein
MQGLSHEDESLKQEFLALATAGAPAPELRDPLGGGLDAESQDLLAQFLAPGAGDAAGHATVAGGTGLVPGAVPTPPAILSRIY